MGQVSVSPLAPPGPAVAVLRWWPSWGHGGPVLAGLAGGLAGALGGAFLLFVLAFLGHRHWRRRAGNPLPTPPVPKYPPRPPRPTPCPNPPCPPFPPLPKFSVMPKFPVPPSSRAPIPPTHLPQSICPVLGDPPVPSCPAPLPLLNLGCSLGAHPMHLQGWGGHPRDPLGVLRRSPGCASPPGGRVLGTRAGGARPCSPQRPPPLRHSHLHEHAAPLGTDPQGVIAPPPEGDKEQRVPGVGAPHWP